MIHDLSVEQLRAILEARRMTARDLVTVAYWHAFEKPVPQGERERLVRQVEGKPDASGQTIHDPLPRYICAFF